MFLCLCFSCFFFYCLFVRRHTCQNGYKEWNNGLLHTHRPHPRCFCGECGTLCSRFLNFPSHSTHTHLRTNVTSNFPRCALWVGDILNLIDSRLPFLHLVSSSQSKDRVLATNIRVGTWEGGWGGLIQNQVHDFSATSCEDKAFDKSEDAH